MKDYSSLLYVMFAFICTFEAESMAHIQQNDLINYLINKDVLRNPHIIQAFKETDRADFIRNDYIKTTIRVRCHLKNNMLP
jgi:hypothetical protein